MLLLAHSWQVVEDIPSHYEEKNSYGVNATTKGSRGHPNSEMNTWQAYEALHPKDIWFSRTTRGDVDEDAPMNDDLDGEGEPKAHDELDFASSGASPGDEDNDDAVTQSSTRSSTRSEATKGPARRDRQLAHAMAHQGVKPLEGETMEDASKRFRAGAAGKAIAGLDVNAGEKASDIYNLLSAAMAAAPRYDIMTM